MTTDLNYHKCLDEWGGEKMENNNHDLNEQFDREVFPTELIEIALRRREVFYPFYLLDFYENQFKSSDEISGICELISNDCRRPLTEENNRIDWLNDILRTPNLYELFVNKFDISSLKPSLEFDLVGMTKKLLNKKYVDLQPYEQYSIKRLNRLILEKKYEGKIPRVQDWKKVLINGLPEIEENVIGPYEELRDAEMKMRKEGRKNLFTQSRENFQKSMEGLPEKGKKNPFLLIKQMYENFSKKETDSAYKLCKDNYEKGKKTLFEKAKPKTNYGLVGLALSGGGIRSATFNLGVLQVLAERDVLKHVDYLSTVSGGGYIGSCLSSVLNSRETGPERDKFPFRHEKGKPEPAAFKHLRNHGNYIAPKGIIDWIKIPALFVRGVLINLLLLLPYVMAAVLITLLFYGKPLRDVKQNTCYIITGSSIEKLKSEGVPDNVVEQLKGKVFTNKEALNALLTEISSKDKNVAPFVPLVEKHIKTRNFSWDWKAMYRQSRLTYWGGIVYVSYVFLFFLIQYFFYRNIKSRTGWDKTFGVGLLLVFLCALIESIVTALSYYLTSDKEWIKPGITAAISFVPVLFAGKAAENVSKWRGKLTLWLLGMLGPFILFLLYLMLCKCMLSECISEKIFFVAALGIFVLTWILADINRTSFHNFYRDQLSKAYLFPIKGKKSTTQPNDEQKLYDEQKLSDLNGAGAKSPYHLINAALNLPGSKDVNLRDRNADFFIFSKHFCGGMKTGYCNTADMEKADSHLNLGTAMAISGAAAAPNMGTTTIKPLVFIMALLNIRLGYWLPNPCKVSEDGVIPHLRFKRCSPFSGVGPGYLFRELIGCLDEKSNYVNISDGGHIENLGIYELLRRKCKYIIACDAEADADLTFGGLAKLIRYARTDLSIDIEIDLDGLRKGENGFSKKHCAMGKIFYGGGETGYLLYIKSSLTGDENEYIREYRSKNNDFPHESTGDQFFDEAQFEAYRALGYHIADKLDGWEVLKTGKKQAKIDNWCVECETEHERIRNTINQEKNLDEWFNYLDTALLPQCQMEDAFFELQVQLSKIEKMYQDPDIAVYAYQVYPELQKKREASDTLAKMGVQPTDQGGNQGSLISVGGISIEEERFRKIFHFCNQQMQLMVNVFIARKLKKPYYRDHHVNRGWMNLFRRWAEAPLFRCSWAVSIGTYSLDFQMFCEDVLSLYRMVRCRPGSADELTQQELVYFTDEKQGNYRFFNEDKKLLPQYSIWIAEMSVCNRNNVLANESFPVGFVIVESKKTDSQDSGMAIVYYHIRGYYRQMKLLEKMIQGMIHAMRVNNEPICVVFKDDEDRRRYSYFFERYGINGWSSK